MSISLSGYKIFFKLQPEVQYLSKIILKNRNISHLVEVQTNKQTTSIRGPLNDLVERGKYNAKFVK